MKNINDERTGRKPSTVDIVAATPAPDCDDLDPQSRTEQRLSRADHRTVLGGKLRSGYALPAFPAPGAPSEIPTPADYLTSTVAVAVFCSALWSGFSPPLTH